ncbi:hypothetical protein [Streptomyces chryseus]|uniref:Uncharacterized protein n=1 Tax=Streptomyces chryseus TaxID=68186 RepID=A0ABQ3EBQ0_9ACTN|nr:hypothetical protein [Streptomyces chryseus]GHB31326.1 hypothetical protein GCM10010346_63390 [Streptomyces chryseus]
MDKLVSYLAGLNVHLSKEDVKRLHVQRSAAQESSGEAAAQIAYWKEQVKQLRHATKTASRAEESLLQELDEAEAELDLLVGDLASALERARLAELGRDAWRLSSVQKRQRLEHAQHHTRQLEEELASTRKMVRLLLRTIQALRKRLEKQVVVEEVKVYELRRQPGFAAYFLDTFRAKQSLEYQKVDTALQAVRKEFNPARQHYNVDNRKGTIQISQKIAELTGNEHWITVGKNVDHLTTVGSALYGSHETGFAGTQSTSAMTPTIESVNSFVAGAETVLAQLNHLRQLIAL